MDKQSLIEFPCLFPVKIIGVNTPVFFEQIKAITLRHFPSFTDKDLQQNTSGQGNYLAITVTVTPESQTALDAFYQEINKQEHVRMVL